MRALTNLYLVRHFLGLPCSSKCPSSALFPTLDQSLGFITQISARPERIFRAIIAVKTKYATNFHNLAEKMVKSKTFARKAFKITCIPLNFYI